MAQPTGLFHYIPSVWAAVVFAALFGLTTAFHTFQIIKWRSWFFIPFLIGGIFETVGYVARIILAKEQPNYVLTPAIIEIVFILVAPALFAASIYMTLGRVMILTHGEKYSIIRRTWMTKIFVTGDVLSFLVQSGGGAMQAGTHPKPDTVKLGQTLIKIGLVIQLIFFAFFVITAIIFHTRLARNPTSATIHNAIPWKKYLWALYASSVLIFIRSLFRLAEYSGGENGTLLGKEWYSYVFDATLMWLVMVGFNAVYPGSIKRYERKGTGDDERGMMPLGDHSDNEVQGEYLAPKPYAADGGFARDGQAEYVAPSGYGPQAGYRPYGQ